MLIAEIYENDMKNILKKSFCVQISGPYLQNKWKSTLSFLYCWYDCSWWSMFEEIVCKNQWITFCHFEIFAIESLKLLKYKDTMRYVFITNFYHRVSFICYERGIIQRKKCIMRWTRWPYINIFENCVIGVSKHILHFFPIRVMYVMNSKMINSAKYWSTGYIVLWLRTGVLRPTHPTAPPPPPPRVIS